MRACVYTVRAFQRYVYRACREKEFNAVDDTFCMTALAVISWRLQFSPLSNPTLLLIFPSLFLSRNLTPSRSPGTLYLTLSLPLSLSLSLTKAYNRISYNGR